MVDEDFQSMVKHHLLGEMIANGATQKVVKIEDAEDHLSDGWEFVDMIGVSLGSTRIELAGRLLLQRQLGN